MTEKKIYKITNLMLIFIILQPLFDILSYLNIRNIIPLGISTYLKPLFAVILAIYIFFNNNMHRKFWIIYACAFIVLIIQIRFFHILDIYRYYVQFRYHKKDISLHFLLLVIIHQIFLHLFFLHRMLSF